MAHTNESVGDDETTLSDIEDEMELEAEPLGLPNSQSDSVTERLKAALLDLESEREARKAAEAAKAKVEETFNKLKGMVRDAMRQRDEVAKQKEEILHEKEGLRKHLEEANKKCSETTRMKDETSKAHETSRSEIESTAQMLISGVERITNRVNGMKRFSGLPKSNKHSGLAAIAYGATKRAEEIVDELMRQNEIISKERQSLHGQMEQRNIQIAIEVSELEATITGLKEDVAKKSKELEKLQTLVHAKDNKISELESKMSEQQHLKQNEIKTLKGLMDEMEDKLRDSDQRMVKHKSIVSDQLKHISKAQECLQDIIKMTDDHAEFSEPVIVSEDLDIDNNFVNSTARALFVSELSEMAVRKLVLDQENKKKEKKLLEDRIISLESEKENITSLLRGALNERNMLRKEILVSSEISGKQNVALTQMQDISLHLQERDQQNAESLSKKGDSLEGPSLMVNSEGTQGDALSLASALENIIKTSQLEILDLRHSLHVARSEIDDLRRATDIQEKDLLEKGIQVQELEKKERAATQNVEALLIDLTAAEEEIIKWKEAAEKEAEAGQSVVKDLNKEINSLGFSLQEMKQSLQEANSKLKSKEDMAAAAVAARDMAERSLQLADERASRLSARIEELTKQLEELDSRDERQNKSMRYKCCPLQMFGVNTIRSYISAIRDSNSNPAEMELSDPLL